jgi:hypothetical protein
VRKLILAAGLLAIAAPALAQPRHEPRYDPRYDRRDEDLRRSLPTGYEIDRMGAMLARITDALMDVDVGPVADAVDPYRRYDHRRHAETLGDLASRDDPYLRERIRGDIRGSAAGLGAAADQIAAAAPVIRQSLRESARRIDEAMREGRERGGYDEDRYERR